MIVKVSYSVRPPLCLPFVISSLRTPIWCSSIFPSIHISSSDSMAGSSHGHSWLFFVFFFFFLSGSSVSCNDSLLLLRVFLFSLASSLAFFLASAAFFLTSVEAIYCYSKHCTVKKNSSVFYVLMTNHLTTKTTNQIHNQTYKYHHLTKTLHLNLKITTTLVVQMPVTKQSFKRLLSPRRSHMTNNTPGFKPFTNPFFVCISVVDIYVS